MELEFKEGERVFDIRYGWGTITAKREDLKILIIFG